MRDKVRDVHHDASDFCDNSVVKVKPPFGLILFICNIFLPGVGTMISALMDTKLNALALLFGFIQFVFALTIVPWVWSIWHGYMIWNKSK